MRLGFAAISADRWSMADDIGHRAFVIFCWHVDEFKRSDEGISRGPEIVKATQGELQ